MTSCLILIDLENLRYHNKPKWSWLPPAPEQLKKNCLCTIDSARLIFALGTDTACLSDFHSHDFFLSMSKDCLSALDIPSIKHTIEIVLVLSVPEAADRALIIASKVSPDNCGCGPFSHVVLLSNDSGLRQQLEKNIGVRFAQNKKKQFQNVFCWHFSSKNNKDLRRTPPDSPIECKAIIPQLPGPTIFIDNDSLASWAAVQPVQLSGNLSNIAVSVERNPSLLTQISITCPLGSKPSARGVERLSRMLSASAKSSSFRLGECTGNEGLEVSVNGPTIPIHSVVKKISPSPLGPGAIRVCFEADNQINYASMRTHLPYCAVKMLEGQCLPADTSSLSINDFRVLKIIPTIIKYYTVQLTKGNSSRSDYCDMSQNTGFQAWWYWRNYNNHTIKSAKFDLPNPITLPADQIEVMCVPVIINNPYDYPGIGWQLALKNESGKANVHSAIAAGKTGLATVCDYRGCSIEIPFLALKDTRAGNTISIRPMHSVLWSEVKQKPAFSTMDEWSWYELRLAPLVAAEPC